MEWEATLSKMSTYIAEEVHYLLKTDADYVHLNTLMGRKIGLKFLNEKYCSACGNQFAELYRMGFCKNCFFTVPQAGESIINPEKSRAQEGIADRDLGFEKNYQLTPHVVYLAISGDLKVGVTRKTQMMTRWADQGAAQAIVFAETQNRYQAGLIEVDMKQHLGDKTPWQRMLKYEDKSYDLQQIKEEYAPKLKDDLQEFISKADEVHRLKYPHLTVPEKVKSINLDKEPEVEGELLGIRGQYLLFEEGRVFNVRRHSGFRVRFSI